jgi:hypothetical protein
MMISVRLIGLISLLTTSFLYGQNESDYLKHFEEMQSRLKKKYIDIKPRYPALAMELVKMGRDDQKVRSAESRINEKKMLQADRRLTAELKRLVNKYGWPTIPKAGWKASQLASVILIHSPDLQFQKKMVLQLKQSFEDQEIVGADIPFLEDKILMQEHQLQRFGTQSEIQNGKLIISPMEDPSHVDERRMKYGLPGLKEYKQYLSATYNMPVQ